MEKGYIELSGQGMKRVAYATQNNLCRACLRPIEPGDVTRRKNHETCYRAQRRAVDRNLTTMRKLIVEGKVAQRYEVRGGRPPSNPVTLELAGF